MVEDDQRLRETITMVLITNHYAISSAGNGVSALPILRHTPPHVLITDVHMPQMDGYELMRITRTFFPEIGVIALSGGCDGSPCPGSDMADAFFAKGTYSLPDLLECVAGLVASYPVRARANLGRLAPSWSSSDNEPAVWVECRNCERPFELKRSAVPLRRGKYSAQCVHCRNKTTFLLAQQSLDRWSGIGWRGNKSHA